MNKKTATVFFIIMMCSFTMNIDYYRSGIIPHYEMVYKEFSYSGDSTIWTYNNGVNITRTGYISNSGIMFIVTVNYPNIE